MHYKETHQRKNVKCLSVVPLPLQVNSNDRYVFQPMVYETAGKIIMMSFRPQNKANRPKRFVFRQKHNYFSQIGSEKPKLSDS